MSDENKELRESKNTVQIDIDVDYLRELRTMKFDTSSKESDSAPDAKQRPTLRLFLPERQDPVVFKGMALITLGRRDATSNTYPTLDLTPDNAQKLGVSRMHAQFELINGGYHVKDLGSSNGTWLNGSKIEPHQAVPVNPSDHVRLGYLMILIG